MLILLIIVGLLLKIHLTDQSDMSFRLISWITFSIVFTVVFKTIIFITIMTVKEIYTKGRSLCK